MKTKYGYLGAAVVIALLGAIIASLSSKLKTCETGSQQCQDEINCLALKPKNSRIHTATVGSTVYTYTYEAPDNCARLHSITSNTGLSVVYDYSASTVTHGSRTYKLNSNYIAAAGINGDAFILDPYSNDPSPVTGYLRDDHSGYTIEWSGGNIVHEMRGGSVDNSYTYTSDYSAWETFFGYWTKNTNWPSHKINNLNHAETNYAYTYDAQHRVTQQVVSGAENYTMNITYY